MRKTTIQLGPRARQVVKLFLQGHDNNAIAQELGISRRTVKAQFHHLFVLFGIRDGCKRVKLIRCLFDWLSTQEGNRRTSLLHLSLSTQPVRALDELVSKVNNKLLTG